MSDSGRAGCVQHVGRPRLNRTSDLIAALLEFHIITLLLGGLMFTIALCVLFALLYWSVGTDCYTVGDDTGFGFNAMLAMSVHTFSSVGYGSVYPNGSCPGAQLLVICEYWSGICIVSVTFAILVSSFLEPRPLIKFSQHFLTAHDPVDDCPTLSFRMVRQSSTELLNARVTVTVTILRRDKGGRVVGGKNSQIRLKSRSIVDFHQMRCTHRIEPDSPLANGEINNLHKLSVMVTSYDTSFLKDTTIFHTYYLDDHLPNRKFDNMIDSSSGDWSRRIIDHTKLNNTTESKYCSDFGSQ